MPVVRTCHDVHRPSQGLAMGDDSCNGGWVVMWSRLHTLGLSHLIYWHPPEVLESFSTAAGLCHLTLVLNNFTLSVVQQSVLTIDNSTSPAFHLHYIGQH